jgi:vacuolar-type H+-ATPase subunit H
MGGSGGNRLVANDRRKEKPMEILDLIDKLEAMTAQAKRVPITGRSMIDAERLTELIDQMRMTVPRNIQDAQEVLERREQIINQTMLDARRIRATAETDARTLVDASELIKQAKERGDDVLTETAQKAERIIALAEAEARRRMNGAGTYAQDSLAKLEEEVLSVLNSIHAGQRLLTPAEELMHLELQGEEAPA